MKLIEVLNPPKSCDVCNSRRIICIEREKIFGLSKDIRLQGRKIWFCRECGANVLCHVGTNNPLGSMADKDVRRLRRELHEKLDPIWKNKITTRQEVYNWLARQLNKSLIAFHIAELTYEELVKSIEYSERLKDATVIKAELGYGLSTEYRIGKYELSRIKNRRRNGRRNWRR